MYQAVICWQYAWIFLHIPKSLSIAWHNRLIRSLGLKSDVLVSLPVKIMFYLASACLSVCLSICRSVCLSVCLPACLSGCQQLNSRKTTDRIFAKIVTRDESVDKEELIKFWKLFASKSKPRIFLKHSPTLRDGNGIRHFSTIRLISVEKSDRNFMKIS